MMAKANKTREGVPKNTGISCDINSVSLQLNKMFVVLFLIICMSGVVVGDKQRCEEISIPMCRGIGYNYTVMPNQFHHDTQEEAGLEGISIWFICSHNYSPKLSTK